MGKMVKLLALLAVLGAGAYFVNSMSGGEDEKKSAEAKDKEAPIQVQEKYGFAPIGVTGDL